MLRAGRISATLLVVFVFALAPMEARLKKVPTSGASVIKPSSTQYKKINPKKMKRKKARFKKGKKRRGKGDVIEIGKFSEADRAARVGGKKKIEPTVQEFQRMNVDAPVPSKTIPVETRKAGDKITVESKALPKKVDQLSESAPEQVTVETLKKKKKKWQFWKRK